MVNGYGERGSVRDCFSHSSLPPDVGATLPHLRASTSARGGGKSRFYETAKGDGVTAGRQADAGRGGAQVLEGHRGIIEHRCVASIQVTRHGRGSNRCDRWRA